jgi:hypothetical protein
VKSDGVLAIDFELSQGYLMMLAMFPEVVVVLVEFELELFIAVFLQSEWLIVSAFGWKSVRFFVPW